MKNNLGDNVAFLFSTREHIASVIYMCVNGEDKWDIIDNSNSYLLADNFSRTKKSERVCKFYYV